VKSITLSAIPAKPRPDLCQAAKIQSFPREIKGQLYPGVQSEELAQLSGYKGPRNLSLLRPAKARTGELRLPQLSFALACELPTGVWLGIV